MPNPYRLALIACGLMLNSACSNLAELPTLEPIQIPPPSRCLVLCPEMPPTDADALTTATTLQDWGSDCRSRQKECRDWATTLQRDLSEPAGH